MKAKETNEKKNARLSREKQNKTRQNEKQCKTQASFIYKKINKHTRDNL